MILFAIVFIVIGIGIIYNEKNNFKFYKELIEGRHDKDFSEITGKVVANELKLLDKVNAVQRLHRNLLYTLVIEYWVNGVKYQCQSEFYSANIDIPVGTEIKVWYKKSEHKRCVLEPDIDAKKKSMLNIMLIGLITIVMGGIVVLICM